MSTVYASAQPAVTTAVDLHTPGSGKEEWLDITACNVSAGAAAINIGIKVSGTTRWLVYTYSMSANSEPLVLSRIQLDDTMTVVVQTNTASAVDFSVNGYDRDA